MNNFLLASQGPLAQPMAFVFETDKDGNPKEWFAFPLRHRAVAEQMERWVARFVLRNAESLRPDDNDKDPVSWRIYNEHVKRTGDDINAGLYGAFTVNWSFIMQTNDDAVAEALFQCVRIKNPEWTRAHVQRYIGTPENYAIVYQSFIEMNFPKLLAADDEPNSEHPNQSQSVGTESSAALSPRLAGMPEGQTSI